MSTLGWTLFKTAFYKLMRTILLEICGTIASHQYLILLHDLELLDTTHKEYRTRKCI